jgi:hypothetical protein
VSEALRAVVRASGSAVAGRGGGRHQLLMASASILFSFSERALLKSIAKRPL